jgi:hypothetical protein
MFKKCIIVVLVLSGLACCAQGRPHQRRMVKRQIMPTVPVPNGIFDTPLHNSTIRVVDYFFNSDAEKFKIFVAKQFNDMDANQVTHQFPVS